MTNRLPISKSNLSHSLLLTLCEFGGTLDGDAIGGIKFWSGEFDLEFTFDTDHSPKFNSPFQDLIHAFRIEFTLL